MKLITLFAAAALASTSALADDLCTVQLQQLKDSDADITALGSPAKEQVQEHLVQAKQAQSAGDNEGCSNHSAKALQLLQAPNKSGQAN